MDDPSSAALLQPLQFNSSCDSSQQPNVNHFKDSDSNPSAVKKRMKRVSEDDGSAPPPSLSPSAGTPSSCSSPSSFKGMRVACRRRNPKLLFGGVRRRRRRGADVEAIALPLGMSFAAVITQVLERNEAANERMSIDHLSMICTLAVRESLANVFGDKFDCFVKNFEKSFGSTLKTLRLINESSINEGGCRLSHRNAEISTSDVSSSKGGYTSNCGVKDYHSGVHCGSTELDLLGQQNSMKGGCDRSHHNAGSSTSDIGFKKGGCTIKEGGSTSYFGAKDGHPRVVFPATASQDHSSIIEEVHENMLTDHGNKELALHRQMNQVASVSTNSLGSIISQTAFSTLEKSVMEQTRSNDLKTLELGISMKRLKLKETELALNYESNHLERSKLAMGVSKASFKAEKFKTQLEDTRHTELLRKCIDCLVAGLFIMSASLAYGAYVFSYKRITEATESCTPTVQESTSWWIPKAMTSFNSGLHIIRCQFQVLSRMVFGILMIVLVAFLLLQRSTTSKDSKPITFILLLLGVFCGFSGKICVDTLGGSGYHWVLYWEVLCFLHFLSDVCTPALFLILHGPVNITQGIKRSAMFPYWSRRLMFYSTVLLFLPLFCGLMPFASPGEWKDHFSELVMDSVNY